MYRISNRLFILTLLTLIVFVISSCGNQELEKSKVENTLSEALVAEVKSTDVAPASSKATEATEETSSTKQLPTTAEVPPRAVEAEAEAEAEADPEEEPEEDPVKSQTESTTELQAKSTTVQTESNAISSAEQSPSNALASEQPSEPIDEVTISIFGDEKKGVILEPTSIELQKNDDVLDVLKRVAKSNRIPLDARGSGMLSYVEGIANLYEFDRGAGSGWLFRINGQLAEKSAGAVKLEKGDVVEWIYSIELSEEPGN